MTINFKIVESSASPIYVQMADQIDRHLRAGRAGVGTRLPDLRSLAGMAGVSLKTADRALNELMRRGLCIRRPKKGTFWGSSDIPTQKRVAAIYHDQGPRSFERNLVQSSIYHGLSQQADKLGVDLVFLTRDPIKSLAFYQSQPAIALLGTAMLHWQNPEKGIELAARFPAMRLVYINYWTEDFERTPENIRGVFNDDAGGAYQMTEQLLRRGHRRIALLGIDSPNYRQRAEGFYACLRDHGFAVNPDLILLPPRNAKRDLREQGARLAQTALARRRGITAIFCVNDIMAAGAADYARNAGLSNRICIAGYDHIIPSLGQEGGFSTIAVDFEAMGAKTMDLLAKPGPNDRKIFRIMPRLIARNDHIKPGTA